MQHQESPSAYNGPNDPRRRLSDSARQRIDRAHEQATLIERQTLVHVEALHTETASTEPLWSFLPSGKACAMLSERRLLAARAVLQVCAHEYRAAGLHGREFRDAIGREVDDAVASLELTTIQRDHLFAEAILSPTENEATTADKSHSNGQTSSSMKQEMADSKFWREMEARFRAIPDPLKQLRADWHYWYGTPGSGEWNLAGISRAPSVYTQFEALGRLAGAAVGDSSAVGSLIVWLEELRLNSRAFEIDLGPPVEVRADDIPWDSFAMGTIQHVCEASADHCVVLESRAFESERAAASGNWTRQREVPMAATPSTDTKPGL